MPLSGIALLALALGAAEPAVLVPPWPFSPDGEVVAVRGGGALSAEGARVDYLGSGLYRVVPVAGRARVRLTSGAVVRDVAVEPPFLRIAITAAPPAPVKGPGRDAEVALTLVVSGGPAELSDLDLPIVAVSAGRVADVAPAGLGRFKARYLLPTERWPELGVVFAVIPRCPLCQTPRALGTAVIPLPVAIDLPGHTEPNVQMSVQIAGRTFGPVRSDSTGSFSIPVVVPPGERLASGTSVDKAGNRKVSPIDLHLPPIDTLACAAWPPAIPADGRSEAHVHCVATDDAGRPLPRAKLEIAARRGKVFPLEPLGEGLYQARYVAPRGGGGTQEVLLATYPAGGEASRQEVAIALKTGAPAEVGFSIASMPVAVGASVPARTFARDGRGDPLPPPRGPAGAAEGFVSETRFQARRELGDYLQLAPLGLTLPPGHEAASLQLQREGGLWLAVARTIDGGPAVGVPLRFGSGAAAVSDARGEARVPAKGPAETVSGPRGLRAAGWEGFALPVPSIAISKEVKVPLQPPGGVDIRVRREGRFVKWRVIRAPGELSKPLRLLSTGVRLGPTEPDGDGWRAEVNGLGVVTVVDPESGVAAVLEVK